MTDKIIQISSVVGPCYAQYVIRKKGKQDEHLITPVQLWALVEDDKGVRRIKGITHLDIQHETKFCEDSLAFTNYTTKKP